MAAQLPPGVEREAGKARIILDDLDRFAGAYRRLVGFADTLALLESAYFADRTPGLAAYARLYDVDAAAVRHAVRSRPDAFREAALRGPIAVAALEDRTRSSFRRLADLYPAAVFPPVFFLVGRDHAGGAVQPEGVLIAVETYTSPRGELDGLVHLVAHELAHYQQAAHDVARYRASNSLLARAIKEGVADYVAELLTGDHINPEAHAYGLAHESELWSRFRCEMDGTETGDWFFRRPDAPSWPQDLGYFVGYRIAAARYARDADPRRALAALLQVDDYRVFLRESGYEALLEGLEGRPFPECR